MLALMWVLPSPAQQPGWDNIIKRMEKEGCTTLESGVKVCRADYEVDGKRVEAISFTPPGNGPFPAVLLIPGYEHSARDMVPFGVRMARTGFAGIAVAQPGFGRSQGPSDFVGSKTLAVLTVAYRKLQKEKYVDPNRMGIYGYSRGGMATSLLAVELDDVKAAVFSSGIYDFQRLYDETPFRGARENMQHETGMKKEAVIERSSILRMDKLKCPVLILHGEQDKNVPVDQAKELRDRLKELHKDFEIKLFPDMEHILGPEGKDMAVDFFRRKLLQTSSSRN